VVVHPDSCVVLKCGCVVKERGPSMVIDQWLCGSGSRSVRGT
jgi:hypothetical protein